MHVYRYSKEILEKKVPITKDEISQLKEKIKIGDVVYKRKYINPFSVERGKFRDNVIQMYSFAKV